MAVVKIEATGLPAVKVGDVTRLKVGEWVMAIGSPFGLENTVTAGIVSAKQRDTGDYLPFIQTDVAINPGNSGGPLINMRGEVVGINSQIYSRSGGFMGISFAIPIDEAIRVSEQLRTSGRVSRGRIGVQIDQVTKDVAESIGLGKPQGALVRSVESGSPADKAGVEAGDIITKFDGKAIDKRDATCRAWWATPSPARKQHDDGVPPRRLARPERDHRRDRAREAGASRTAEKEEKPKALRRRRKSIGLVVSELTDAQKKELKIKGGVQGRRGHRQRRRAPASAKATSSWPSATPRSATCKEFDAAVAKADKSKPIPVLLRRGELGDVPADPAGALSGTCSAQEAPARSRVWGLFLRRCRKRTARLKIFFRHSSEALCL